jgi:hypothetical protein
VKARSGILSAAALVILAALCSCHPTSRPSDRRFRTTLRDYAQKARQHGSREQLVPYAFDEEEGESLMVQSLDSALDSYEWIIGEPIEEKVLTLSRIAAGLEPDLIFTVYRFRVERRSGKTKYHWSPGDLGVKSLKGMVPGPNEILVIKSGGNTVVDGVLLKKRNSLCFSELMPRRYLLALSMDPSGKLGIPEMGCRSIFAIDGDRLSPRQTDPEIVTLGMKERFGDSLAALFRELERPKDR